MLWLSQTDENFKTVAELVETAGITEFYGYWQEEQIESESDHFGCNVQLTGRKLKNKKFIDKLLNLNGVKVVHSTSNHTLTKLKGDTNGKVPVLQTGNHS